MVSPIASPMITLSQEEYDLLMRGFEPMPMVHALHHASTYGLGTALLASSSGS